MHVLLLAISVTLKPKIISSRETKLNSRCFLIFFSSLQSCLLITLINTKEHEASSLNPQGRQEEHREKSQHKQGHHNTPVNIPQVEDWTHRTEVALRPHFYLIHLLCSCHSGSPSSFIFHGAFPLSPAHNGFSPRHFTVVPLICDIYSIKMLTLSSCLYMCMCKFVHIFINR